MAFLGQILPIRTNFENFDEARRNPDKLTGPLSGQKVLFQDQGSPTIARGPGSIGIIRSRHKHRQTPYQMMAEYYGDDRSWIISKTSGVSGSIQSTAVNREC